MPQILRLIRLTVHKHISHRHLADTLVVICANNVAYVQDAEGQVKAEVTSSGLGNDRQLASSSGASQSQINGTTGSDPADANATGLLFLVFVVVQIMCPAFLLFAVVSAA